MAIHHHYFALIVRGNRVMQSPLALLAAVNSCQTNSTRFSSTTQRRVLLNLVNIDDRQETKWRWDSQTRLCETHLFSSIVFQILHFSPFTILSICLHSPWFPFPCCICACWLGGGQGFGGSGYGAPRHFQDRPYDDRDRGGQYHDQGRQPWAQHEGPPSQRVCLSLLTRAVLLSGSKNTLGVWGGGGGRTG